MEKSIYLLSFLSLKSKFLAKLNLLLCKISLKESSKSSVKTNLSSLFFNNIGSIKTTLSMVSIWLYTFNKLLNPVEWHTSVVDSL